MISKLVYLTMQTLELLINKYEDNSIGYNDFFEHTQLKIQFLDEHINVLDDTEKIQKAKELMYKYVNLLNLYNNEVIR